MKQGYGVVSLVMGVGVAWCLRMGGGGECGVGVWVCEGGCDGRAVGWEL